MITARNPVRLELKEGIAFIVIDNPPVNASSQAVRAGILEAVARVQSDPNVVVAVIAADGRTFIAGGDINEFSRPPLSPALPEVCNAIEASSKPVVAAIHGTALGGGLEIALACHARVLADDARVGLPEVKLGLIPGAGGTQRLPRLIGMLPALEMIVTGKEVSAEEARGLGIADHVADGNLRDAAASLARSLTAMPLRRSGELPVQAFDEGAADACTTGIGRKARGQVAPMRAAEMVRLSATLPLAEGLARERATFLDLMSGSQSRALRHTFFGAREAMHVPDLDRISPRKVERACVVGAGTMGAGIAVALSDAGIAVAVVETSGEAVEAGRGRIRSLYDRMQKSGRISPEEHAARLRKIALSTDFSTVSEADLVIEAVFEDMAVKQSVFHRLGETAKAGAVLATNTSYLDIEPIAAASGRLRDVIGLHFFAPANIMRLLEIVRCRNSAPDALATGLALAKRLGKIPVIAGVCDGFVGNRISAVYRAQAELALEDGALPHEIDAAMEAFGFPMGPFAVADLSGLDIAWARRKRLASSRDPRTRYGSSVADRLCEMGRLGQKTNAGWYSYEGGKRAADPLVINLIESVSARLGITRKPIAGDALQRRFRAVMVNEGAKIISEGIVARSLDIDMALVHGFGYPSWRGGPMFEADEMGAAQILADMQHLSATSGHGWEPAPLLLEMAARGAHFSDWRSGSNKSE